MRKKVNAILYSIIIIIALQSLISIFIYPGYDHWRWLGYPSLLRIIAITADNYPGHSIDCIKYDDFTHEWKGDKNEYVYDEDGKGINIAGINIHVGDTKSHVQHELRYGNLDGNEYQIVCYLCLSDFYILKFEYNQNDVLIKMTIEYIANY